MAKHVIIIRLTSAMRNVSADEAVSALPAEEQRLDRTPVEVATTPFKDSVEQGDWDGNDQYLREQAAKIRAVADTHGESVIHFFGIGEVPHLVALGAHVGGERLVAYHDHNRDSGSWRWSTDAQTVSLVTAGEDDLRATVKGRGPVVIRVAISSTITDADVRAVVGDETLADVTITHADGVPPSYGLIKSAADVRAVRALFRKVYALIRNARPNLDVVHLFVSGSPSVCFAIGQELSLHNAPPVQTYRHRKVDGEPSQQIAIRLSARPGEAGLAPLTEAEVKAADRIRKEVWPKALEDIETYAANQRNGGHANGYWYDGFAMRDALRKAAPFPSLPALARFVPSGVAVDPEPFVTRDFGFEGEKRRWRLNDRLLLGFEKAMGRDDARLRQVIRLFLLHEYVHLYHSIGKHTAEQVGKFANSLEHVDFTADTYALLHQLDLSRYQDGKLVDSFEHIKAFLAGQLELVLRSFWAFDALTENEWQVRRLRRYMNWYWRLVQVQNAESMDSLLLLFTHQPRVELGGLYQVARGRRVIAFLDRLDQSTHLEFAVVLENEILFRQSDSPNTNLRELLESFRKGEHEKILEFFRSIYDVAKPLNGVQPQPVKA